MCCQLWHVAAAIWRENRSSDEKWDESVLFFRVWPMSTPHARVTSGTLIVGLEMWQGKRDRRHYHILWTFSVLSSTGNQNPGGLKIKSYEMRRAHSKFFFQFAQWGASVNERLWNVCHHIEELYILICSVAKKWLVFVEKPDTNFFHHSFFCIFIRFVSKKLLTVVY